MDNMFKTTILVAVLLQQIHAVLEYFARAGCPRLLRFHRCFGHVNSNMWISSVLLQQPK
jgi:hypothetical protein